jgi:purine-nucleoside phosphorylase
MEAAGLYMNAARAGKRALCVCTVSNHILRGEELPAKDREMSFREMIEIALDTAVLAETL